VSLRKEALTDEWYREYINPPICDLIIKMNKLPFIRTISSCGGNYSLDDCSMYHLGIMFFVDKDSNEGRKFIAELKETLKDYPFVHLKLPYEKSPLPQYDIEADWFEFPELRNKSKDEKKAFLEEMFNQTYGRLNTGLENFVEGWLKKEDVVNDLSLAGS